MKIPNALAMSAALLLSNYSSLAQIRPAQPALANYDARKGGANTNAASLASSWAPAESALTSRLPTVRVSRDPLLGSPRLIATPLGFLSGPGGAGLAISAPSVAAFSPSDPYRAVKAFVNEHSGLFGFGAGALSNAPVKRDSVTTHSGLRTTVWQQAFEGVEVFDGVFVGHISRSGALVSVSSFFVPDPAAAANVGSAGREAILLASPPIPASSAISLAAANLGGSTGAGTLTGAPPTGTDRHQSLTGSGLRGSADVRLVWLPLSGGSMRLAWWVVLSSTARPEMYSLVLDAETGQVIVRRCLTSDATAFTYNVYTSDSPSPFSPGLQTPGSTQPPITNRNLVTLTALNTNASPGGWITTGSQTLGNNVDAHLDRTDDDVPDLPRPIASGNVFNFPLDLTTGPLTYGDAAVVNLFYWNNFMHDKLYELGFTESAGNFQTDNFGRGGAGNDAVQADGQDGGGTDNANFSTPPDGLPGRMQMYLFSGPVPERDGDLDSEVMAHEYAHGLSNRLLGGGVGIFAWQPSGMGEGWSDFYGLSLLSEPADNPHAAYAPGGYLTYQFFGIPFTQNYYFGIRRYPYSTDLSKNPLTLKDIDSSQASPHIGVPTSPLFGGSFAGEVHNMGEVWCVALWEARANLIDKLGYSVGNKLILQLVTDGLKLAPGNATFLEARDAILEADVVNTGGDNLVELWTAFAKRGMGFSATVPNADETVGVVEAFDLPNNIFPGPEDGVMELSVTPAAGAVLLGGTATPVFVRVTDRLGLTNATILATAVGAPNPLFRNDGVLPDVLANNAVYSASLVPPVNSSGVTLTLVISAPGKVTTTNVITYAVVPPPPNDNFANAIKVPSSGTNYVSNNRFATEEIDEPAHAGVPSAAASLWWNYVSPSNTVLLIDTAGSGFDTIIAVYTNQTLATLNSVIAADDVGTRLQAWISLNVTAGVTYRVAVAGYDESSFGSLFVNFQPNGVPDTNAPSVTVTAPLDGLTVTTNQVVVTGTATDPDPAPSGIQDIFIRVNPGLDLSAAKGTVNDAFAWTASVVSTNWSRVAALNRGLNSLQVMATDRAGNRSAPVQISVNYLAYDPPNDFFVLASPLTANPEVVTGNNNKATKEIGEPDHAGVAGGKSVWWIYQPPGDGTLTLSTTNSTFDTLLGLYTGDRANAVTLVAANDDASAGVPGGFSKIVAAVRAGVVYHIAVDGYDGVSGTVVLHYTFVPGTVYHVNVSSGIGGVATPASADFLGGSMATLTATPNAGYGFDAWGGDVFMLSNPLTVLVGKNLSLTASFRQIPVSDGFESGNLGQLGWTTGGNVPWLVQTNVIAAGNFAARSGAMTNNQVSYQSSSLFLTANFRAGGGEFDYRVSSEPNFDTFSFLLDGVVQHQPPWSGEVAWAKFSFPLTAGIHNLEWRYTKDPTVSGGLDAAFIDNINLPLVPAIDSTTPATLQMRRQTDGQLFVELTGQTNQQYVLQASTNFLSWQNFATNVAVGGVIRVFDPAATSNSLRFYRAVAAP